MDTNTHGDAPVARNGSDLAPEFRIQALLRHAVFTVVRFAAVRLLGPGRDVVAMTVLHRAFPHRMKADGSFHHVGKSRMPTAEVVGAELLAALAAREEASAVRQTAGLARSPERAPTRGRGD